MLGVLLEIVGICWCVGVFKRVQDWKSAKLEDKIGKVQNWKIVRMVDDCKFSGFIA